MIYLLTFLMISFDPGLKIAHANVPEEINIPAPKDVPDNVNAYTGKLLLDLAIHKIKYGTDVSNAVSLIPTTCFRHITNDDVWRVLTYPTEVCYHSVQYKISLRIYSANDCRLDKKYWKYWEPYLIDF